MKILSVGKKHTRIFLNNMMLKDLPLENKDQLEDGFRKLFLNLKDNYGKKFSGYYNIFITYDKKSGAIIDMNREDIEYYDYFDSQVDMRIVFKNDVEIVYEIECPLNIKKDKGIELFTSNNKYYLRLIEKKDFYTLGSIIEQSNDIIELDLLKDNFKIIKI